MDEKRAVSRRRTFYAAQLFSRNGIAWSEGVVRNLSDAGALIEFPNAATPETLDIVVPAAGLRVGARVAWRGVGRAGLQFEPAPGRIAPAWPARSRADDPNY